MTKLKLLPAALIAAAMLTTPAMARESHVTSQHQAKHANASTTCNPAPRVGAFATQPWDNGPPCEPAPGY
jgi:hypothetical protein